MAKALSVLDVEREKADWLTVIADDGKVYRFERRTGRARPPAHIESEYIPGGAIRARVAKDRQGLPLLKKDGQGLPQKIVVNYISDVTDRGALASYWSGEVEYELVSSDYQFKPGDAVRHPSKGLVGTVIDVHEGEGNIFAENVTYTVKWNGSFPPEGMISWKELEATPAKIPTTVGATAQKKRSPAAVPKP